MQEQESKSIDVWLFVKVEVQQERIRSTLRRRKRLQPMPKSKPNLSKGAFPIALKLCKLKGIAFKFPLQFSKHHWMDIIYRLHDNGVVCVDGEGDREKITTVRNAAVYQDLQAEITGGGLPAAVANITLEIMGNFQTGAGSNRSRCIV